MGANKELGFEQSTELTIIDAVLKGLKNRRNKKAEEEAAAAKQRNSLIPHILEQLQFQQTEERKGEEFRQTETRGREEFQQRQGLAQETFDFQKANAQFNRDFDLKLQDMKNTFSNLSREDEQSFDLKMSELKQSFDLRMQELNQGFDLRLQQSTQAFQDRQRQARETFRAGESGKQRTFTTEEREASQAFKKIDSDLNRELQRDLRGKVFEGEEQIVLIDYRTATERYEGFVSLLLNPENQKNVTLTEAAASAANEMARLGSQLAPIYESKGLAPPFIPPKIQPFEQKFLARDTQFGFIPRLTVPTTGDVSETGLDVGATVSEQPSTIAPSNNVSRILSRVPAGVTELPTEQGLRLMELGVTAEELNQINDELAKRK